MTALPDDLFEPTTPPNLGAAPPRKCRRHDWAGLKVRADDSTARICVRCGKVRDDVAARRGRNNRKRGGAAELTAARTVGGRKVGPLGHPWDVEIEGYMRLQVKKLATLPSLRQVGDWMDAIPMSREMRGVAVLQPGRGARRFLVLDLDEFGRWHGDPLEGKA